MHRFLLVIACIACCLYMTPVKSQSGNDVEKYLLDCFDCESTRESAYQALSVTVTDIQPFKRIIYVKVPRVNQSSKNEANTKRQKKARTAQEESLKQFVFVIKANESVLSADYTGISNLPCPRCSRIEYYGQ